MPPSQLTVARTRRNLAQIRTNGRRRGSACLRCTCRRSCEGSSGVRSRTSARTGVASLPAHPVMRPKVAIATHGLVPPTVVYKFQTGRTIRPAGPPANVHTGWLNAFRPSNAELQPLALGDEETPCAELRSTGWRRPARGALPTVQVPNVFGGGGADVRLGVEPLNVGGLSTCRRSRLADY
jgi:hypothetical protein